MASDQLNFLIFAPDIPMQQRLRQAVMGYSVRADADIRMDWLSSPGQLVHLAALAGDAHIALLDADAMPHSLAAGQAILRANPACRIVYFGHRAHDLACYFPARPVAYLDLPVPGDEWEQLFRSLHREIRESGAYFSWTSKFCRYHIPAAQIVAVRSSQGNLEVCTSGGAIHTMPGKLDEAEKRLDPGFFLRIHKSTLVNVRFIRAMDRSDKSLILHDGSRAYISKAHYKTVSRFMEDLMHTKTAE